MAFCEKVCLETLQKAAKRLVSGGLVAFPTETVFGLGANALDENAVAAIFAAKGRPRTDPLIVHVPDYKAALRLVNLNERSQQVFSFIGERCWPGPLTIVTQAASCVPAIVTANTGFVGVRVPNQKTARQLLEIAQVPVAAPSANKFGHVSPTTAQHVLEDLADSSVMILDDSEPCCLHGIESTVVKLVQGSDDDDRCSLEVLRKGAYTIESLTQVLSECPVAVAISAKRKRSHEHVVADISEPQIAPGQALRHYAPNVTTYILRSGNDSSVSERNDGIPLRKCVVLDFHGKNAHLKKIALDYRDLSADGSVEEAARNMFALLRWSELVLGAECILVPDFEGDQDGTLFDGVADRIFRASVGESATVLDDQAFKIY